MFQDVFHDKLIIYRFSSQVAGNPNKYYIRPTVDLEKVFKVILIIGIRYDNFSLKAFASLWWWIHEASTA